MRTHGHDQHNDQDGFTLLEALVALAIVALVVTSFLGIRAGAIAEGLEARNWRLAREIAQERMSELIAGAHEIEPQSGVRIALDERYPGFAYQILRGESSIAEAEAALANAAATEDSATEVQARDRRQWQQDRDLTRKAEARGMSAYEYQDQVAAEDLQRELDIKAPSENEFEAVAVIVTFPKVNPSYEGQEDSLVIKSKVSTLAWSGMTPQEAQQEAERLGQSATGDAASGASPTGGAGSSGSTNNPFAGGAK